MSVDKNENAKRGGGLIKILLPLLVVVAIAYGLYEFVIKKQLEGKAEIPAYVHDPNDTSPRPAQVGPTQ